MSISEAIDEGKAKCSRREASIVLEAMLSLGKASLSMKNATLSMVKDRDAELTMRHVFASLERIEEFKEKLERLAIECEIIVNGQDSQALRMKHIDPYGRVTLLGTWRRRLFPKPKRVP